MIFSDLEEFNSFLEHANEQETSIMLSDKTPYTLLRTVSRLKNQITDDIEETAKNLCMEN